MKLSSRARCSTRLLLDLAQHAKEEPVCIGDIAKRQNISVKYLEQLVRHLKRAGLIVSVRGAKGGHKLAKKPEEISFGELVRLFERESHLVDCILRPEKCPMSNICLVRSVWEKAARAMYRELDSITVSSLLAQQSQSQLAEACGSFKRVRGFVTKTT